MSVADRAALVVGATAVGAAVARMMADAGARVALADDDENKLRSLLPGAAGTGFSGPVLARKMDSASDARLLMSDAVASLGGLDILVTAFDVAADDEFLSMRAEDWGRVLNGNLTRVFLVCQAAAAHMARQQYGRIVNVAARDWLGWHRRANYAASKAGVVGLTRTIAWELIGQGITANAVAPGWIDDERSAAMDAEVVGEALQMQPIGRLGSATEVAGAVLFLAGDEASYLTGQTLYVDGGRSILSSLTA
ncbi:SDR family oxidoreductase [soil metagenome]|nr:SDR family oxidoreductase [Acidobacteriota bacterium]